MTLKIRVTENVDGSRSVEIDDVPAPQIHVHAIRTAGIDVQADRAVSKTDQPRFIKLGEAGQPLSPDAATWSAVHDTTMGLIWSADNAGDKRLTHAKAKAKCERLELAGASDWRLPTRTELLTLVDDARHDPAIDTAFFPKTESAYYWTSTPCAWRPASAAWCVYFSFGDVYGYFHDLDCFVRAVRLASPASGQ
jgi:hypothetical protein